MANKFKGKTKINRRFKKSKNPQKKYSSEEKYFYHSDRDGNCGKYGLKFGSPAHCYSAGFRDAFHGRNNTTATTGEFGKKSGKAYALGYKRGADATWEYFQRTGKQPSHLDFEK